MNMPFLPVETDRLTFRAFQKSDLEQLAGFYLLPEAQRYVELRARDRDEVRVALDMLCRQTRLHRPGDALATAVVRSSDERLVGMTALHWTDATAAQAELRFVFDPAFRRQGYAAEALRKALDFAFEDFGLHRVYARCGGRSQGSARVLKDLGLRLEAHYREHALFQGEWDEELHFAILDREWLRGTKVKELRRNMVA